MFSFSAESLVNAISLGALYALIAVGYTMVYGIIKLINFAHGEIYMLGAFWALLVVGLEAPTGINLFVAVVPSMILCAAVGVAVDWSAYLSLRRKLPLADWLSVALLALLSAGTICYKLTGDAAHAWHSETARHVLRWSLVAAVPALMLVMALAEKGGFLGRSLGVVKSDRLSALITAIGMSLILQQLVMLVWGADYRVFPETAIPELMKEEVFSLFGAPVLGKELVIWVVALGMMVLLQLLVSRTRIGMAMRACSMDQETASLMGVSVDRVIAFTFLVGSAMAAVAGVLYAAKVGGNISFRMGYYPGLLAFAAAVLGGIGNIRGAMLGGVLIGFVQGFTGGTFSIPFLVMILVLLILPRGILGEPTAERA
jgi:branched-chain amino acid transport system permease protein